MIFLKKNVVVIIDFTTIGDLQIKMEKVSNFFLNVDTSICKI